MAVASCSALGATNHVRRCWWRGAALQEALASRMLGRFLLLALLLDRLALRPDLPALTPPLFRHDAEVKSTEQVRVRGEW